MPFIIRRASACKRLSPDQELPAAVADHIPRANHALQRLLFLLKSKIAGVATFLAIDHALRAAFCADLFVINGRVKGLGLLQALAADRGFKVVTRQKARAALGALQAVHLAFWLPAPEQSHDTLFTKRNNQCIAGEFKYPLDKP
jgi:hypothetical protein